jgi:hypothetical protein
MNFYRARLDRRYPCGNYKVLDYWVQAPRKSEALRHVRKRHPSWRLLSLRRVGAPEVEE